MNLEHKEKLFTTYFWILLLVGFFVVSIFPGTFQIDSQVITIPFRTIVLLLSSIIILRKFYQQSYKNYQIIEIAFLLFWLLYFSKAIYTFQNFTFLPNMQSKEIETYLRIVGITFIPAFAVLNLKKSDIDFKLSYVIIYSIILIVLVLNILIGIQHDHQGRTSGIMGMYSISFGHWGVSLVVLSLYQLLYKFITNKYFQISAVLGFFTGLYIMYASGTRSPVVALVLGVLFLLWVKNKQKILFGFLALLFIGVVALVILKPQFSGENESSFFSRITKSITTGDSSGRGSLYQQGIQIFSEHPILGGRILYEDGMYPHNIFLEVLMATGMVGFVLYFLFFKKCIQYIYNGKSVSEKYPEIIWVLVLWVQYFTLSLFSYNLHSSPEIWYLSALVLILNKESE
jgi:O-antigen ligase